MPIALALAAAATWGAADFLGGLASRALRPLQVLFFSQIVGLVGLLVAVAFIRGHPAASDMAWGAIGGLLGNAGLYGLYRELARGPAGIVAPTTAVSAALTPVVVGLLLGERPSVLTLTGIGGALVAVTMLAGGGHDHAPDTPLRTKVRVALHGGFWIALLSGLGFGAFYVCLAQTSKAAGLWPLVGSRSASVLAMLCIPSAWRGLRRIPWRLLKPATAAGVLDASANAAYVVAARAGALTVVPVLASLYPASTVLLSRTVHDERLTRVQLAGLVLALGAVAAITAGRSPIG